MGLPRDYDPNRHDDPDPPRGEDFFKLNLAGKPWAEAALDDDQIASLLRRDPADEWRLLSLVEVHLAMDGKVHYEVHTRERVDVQERARSVSLIPRHPGERFDAPSGRLRACITIMPGQLALQCWDENGKEVAGQEYLQV